MKKTHNGNYGHSCIRTSWGKLYFHAKHGNTGQGELIAESPKQQTEIEYLKTKIR